MVCKMLPSLILTENIVTPTVDLIDLSEFSNSIELVTDSDGNSLLIDIPDGLLFGDRVLTSAYVSH